MRRQVLHAAVAIAAVSLHTFVAAQDAPALEPTVGLAARSTPSTPSAGCMDCIVIPALTPVKLELMDTLGSKLSTSGQQFSLRLVEPIIIAGTEIISAGVTGRGEVIHAKKSGMGGGAGELVLAARHLDVNGRQLRLRSLNFSLNGRSNVDTVNAILVASAAVAPPLALVGFFISGGQTTVMKGTIAAAKTAEAFKVPAADLPAAGTRMSQPASEDPLDQSSKGGKE